MARFQRYQPSRSSATQGRRVSFFSARPTTWLVKGPLDEYATAYGWRRAAASAYGSQPMWASGKRFRWPRWVRIGCGDGALTLTLAPWARGLAVSGNGSKERVRTTWTDGGS